MIEKIRKLYRAEPFCPFAIRLTDGRSVRVTHTDYFAFCPTGKKVYVWESDDSFARIDIDRVADVFRQPEAPQEAA